MNSISAKICADHLRRIAYIYVRQSTEHQVLNNLESQQRQYQLADIAKSYGWTRETIVVIDDDLGRSGSSAAGRAGFARLVADVALSKAGIVFGLEVSRLARNNRDWYQLLDLCSITCTLIADADGIYDPSCFNDRLLLGLKGTMSEAEIHVLKGRMLAGLKHKASKGALKFHLPAGYQFNEEGNIVKAHDEQVAHIIKLSFDKFFELRSVNGLLKYLLEEGLQFPRKASCDHRIRWVRPYYKALYDTLTNPIYAGTYVYGRTKIVKELNATGDARSRQKKLAMKDWEVVIHDHHPSYVPWSDFLKVREMIEKNRTPATDQASTVIREGAALLQGLARCGRCGRPLRVRYHGQGKRSYPYYVCVDAIRFGGRLCQSIGSRRIDATVARHFLEEMAPARFEAHLEAIRQLQAQEDQVLKQLELELERAEYEAERGSRQFQAVEPENRLVARTLESQWNEGLKRVEEAKEKIAQRRAKHAQHLSQTDVEQMKSLIGELATLWNAPATTDKDRKELLRAVIDEVQITKQGREISLKILWKGGAIVDKEFELPAVPERFPSSANLVELLRELAARHTDQQIARIMIRKGIKTPTGLSFSAHRVASLRLNHGIACYRESNDRNQKTHTVEEAAEILQVAIHTIYLWVKGGLLKAEQVTSGAPWAVYISDEDKKRLTAEDAPPGWLPLEAAARECAVSKQTVVNWVKEGKIKFVYVTKGRRRGLRIDVNSMNCKAQTLLFK